MLGPSLRMQKKLEHPPWGPGVPCDDCSEVSLSGLEKQKGSLC